MNKIFALVTFSFFLPFMVHAGYERLECSNVSYTFSLDPQSDEDFHPGSKITAHFLDKESDNYGDSATLHVLKRVDIINKGPVEDNHFLVWDDFFALILDKSHRTTGKNIPISALNTNVYTCHHYGYHKK